MDLAGTAGVHSLPDELLIRVFSLILHEVEMQTHSERKLRSVPLWLLLVCKKWHALLSGPSDLFADFCVDLRSHEYPASNSAAMRVLLARLRGARDLKICYTGEGPVEPDSSVGHMFARLLCNFAAVSLPVLHSLDIILPFDITSGKSSI